VSIEHLIESIGLPARELKRYLLSEIDEFLDATDPADREEEFGDVLFALMSMAWAHAGRHYALRPGAFEAKIRQRLRTYATLTRHPPRFLHERIPELPFGVLHFAFGHFTGQWTDFDPLKNGTVAEIHLLTEAPFERPGRLTNHCILTFDDVETLEYQIIDGATDTEGGNIVLCRIPDFMFRRAKRDLQFRELTEYLSLQVLAAIDRLRFVPGAVAHVHSWEGGFLIDSDAFRARMESFRTLFSPYLTVGRLASVVEQSGEDEWTMTPAELAEGARYERKLGAWSSRVVVESTPDCAFYRTWVDPDRLLTRSFARRRQARFSSDPADASRLTFVAGGRPVREKGFVELCRQFAHVRAWAEARGVTASLAILCRDRRADKGARYIEAIEQEIGRSGLTGCVTVEARTSLEQLCRRIADSTAVIAPSLYEPFGLMATYAVENERPAFVSCHAGIVENFTSSRFTFDPLVEMDLVRVIARWHEERPAFEYDSRFPSYKDLYLSGSPEGPWA
jgi:hypothetical protein